MRRIRMVIEDRVGKARGRVRRSLHPAPGFSPLGDRRRRLATHRLARAVHRRARRPGARRVVALDSLLLGDQADVRADLFGVAVDRIGLTSLLIDDWPHTRLLRAGGPLSERVEASGYGDLAARCASIGGHFFGARTPAEVERVAAEVVESVEGGAPPPRRGRSAAGTVPRVRPVAGTDLFQVVDGHHRLASARVRGARTGEVEVERRGGRTALQRTLRAMSWLGGSQELYQPVDAPEIGPPEWVPVRRCTDRMEMIERWFADHGHGAGTSLDVAANYGWFVARFAALGFDARGVELDPLSPAVAEAVYALDRTRISVGTAEAHLAGLADRAVDVVTCFSLLHHFVLGRAGITAEALLAELDRVTGRVLFLDTGQSTEAWFAGALQGWTPEHIQRWLAAGSTFDHVEPLGADRDGTGPYAGNYGRTMFACWRT